MIAPRYLFIEPVDALLPRGNRLFGNAGDYSEAVMPPWPSAFSGALRTRVLADRGVPFAEFAVGELRDESVRASLGVPEAPGQFRLSLLTLARSRKMGGHDPLLPVPADIVAVRGPEGALTCHAVEPVPLPGGVKVSGGRAVVPALRVAKVVKPEAGLWLDAVGVADYAGGRLPDATRFVKSVDLWKVESRLGIGLDPERRTAREGLLYTSDAIHLCPGVGFLVGVAGAEGLLPTSGLVRLGGDGRGAHVTPVRDEQPLWTRVPKTEGFRMVLTTPGIFPSGALPPGIVRRGETLELSFRGLRAEFVASAVSRAQVISGWDLAAQQPKPAQRAVPAGSVYWFHVRERDDEALRELAAEGLWPLFDKMDLGARQRRAEGFGNVLFADWQPKF